MLTVLIECGAEGGPLAVSLAALVPGAVEGLVREVVVLDAGLDAAAREVADHAGCRIVPTDDLRSCVRDAKGDWLLLLEPGASLEPEWIEAVFRHVMTIEPGKTPPRPARFARRDRPGFFVSLVRRPPALADGLLLHKSQAVSLAERAASVEAIAKGVVATGRLDAAIRPRDSAR